MGLIYTVSYHSDVVDIDIPKLPNVWKKKLKRSIENKLTTAPETFGKPLRRSLKGYRRLRVGDYRAIFKIEKKRVKIFVIQHRSVVYQNIETRI